MASDVTLAEEERSALFEAMGTTAACGCDFCAGSIAAVERIVAARVAAAERKALERAAQAIEAERIPRPKNEGDDGYNEGLVDAIVVVRDPMPRKDGDG